MIIAENLEQGICFVILLHKTEVTAAIVGTDFFFFNREEIARRERISGQGVSGDGKNPFLN